MDLVLSAQRPRLTESHAVEAARSLFGVSAVAARDLGSERDRTLALEDSAGRPRAILKVSPGRSGIDASALDDAALIAWGETTARLGLALRGFAHPSHRTAQTAFSWPSWSSVGV